MTTLSFLSRLRRRITFRGLRLTALMAALLVAAYMFHLDRQVVEQFEGRKFSIPARVYARPLELFEGLRLRPEQLEAELKQLRYSVSPAPTVPGHFVRGGNTVLVMTRRFTFWDGVQEPRSLRVEFSRGRVVSVRDEISGDKVDIVRIDPLAIGGIYPAHNEDRLLVRLKQVPQPVIDALIAIEDRKFYQHHGIDPRGIARAVLSLVTSRRAQGGSTVTQQLVKNFFLTSERTLTRKFNEVLMAVLLELHYGKEEILETYFNEVYLGQDGNRAIHGFGLASQFYFNRPIEKIEPHQAALLVGMLKGPGYYDPRRFPARATARRNLVLSEMQRLGYLDSASYEAARARDLNVSTEPGRGTSPHPAYVDLVHRQLRRDYRDEDLRSEGLQIFTALDPAVQQTAERVLEQRLNELERARRLPANTLEGSVVVTNANNGELQAIVGGRRPRFEGFNRAVDAKRQIGSLIKPAVYLAALSMPERYTLVTPLDDNELVWKERGIDDWKPNNYDKAFHGAVPLRSALANSYNVATARLGLALGVDRVIETVRKLGVDADMPPYASTLLGTVHMAPIEVAQMYQTIAGQGFRTPLRAIREVLTAEGQPLQRYKLAVQQEFAAEPVYLLTAALEGVVREGTARGLQAYLPEGIVVAGKTGTTDDSRDSWFAGFTGDRVAVVWVGNDENQNTTLSGSSGAMTVWGDMMARLDPESLALPVPENIERVRIDPESGLRADEGCAGAVELPFIKGSAPEKDAPCVGQARGKRGWLRRLFNSK